MKIETVIRRMCTTSGSGKRTKPETAFIPQCIEEIHRMLSQNVDDFSAKYAIGLVKPVHRRGPRVAETVVNNFSNNVYVSFSFVILNFPCTLAW